MATHDVDQKLLGRLAKRNSRDHPLLSAALYQILGLSVLLARRLIRARMTRKADSPRDTKSLALYHHIIWLSREGLSLLENYVIPDAGGGQLGPELRVFAAKLRASFYHVFCLFHNHPPVTQLNPTPHASPRQGPAHSTSPLSPRQGNGQRRRTSPRNSPPRQGRVSDKENKRLSPSPTRNRKAALRETIPSMVSEASYITNPYAAVSPPPGIMSLPSIQNPSNFLLPAQNYLPVTTTIFDVASKLATELLPGSSPLRLSVALEHCAYLWDCVHDHEGSRRLARKTIRDVYRAQEGMDDEEFEDSAVLVGTLGRMMRRKSQDGTPRFGDITPPPVRPNKSTAVSSGLPPPMNIAPGTPSANVAYRPPVSVTSMPPPGFDITGGGVGTSASNLRTATFAPTTTTAE